MNYKEHVDKFSTQEQQEIVRCVNVITEQQKNGKVEGMELALLFDYWNRTFPTISQKMNCKACRKTVVKFFGLLADDITNG